MLTLLKRLGICVASGLARLMRFLEVAVGAETAVLLERPNRPTFLAFEVTSSGHTIK